MPKTKPSRTSPTGGAFSLGPWATPAARGAKAYLNRRGTLRVLAVLVGSAMFQFAGLRYVFAEPRNPAVYLLLYAFSIPILATWYYDRHATGSPGKNRTRLATFVATLLWTIMSLALTVALFQSPNWVTAAVWLIFVLGAWTLTAWGFDLSFDGLLRKHARETWKSLRGA